jgi:ABC-type transport system substrate-binding protein
VVFGDFDSKSTASKSQLRDVKLDAMIAKARTVVDESERLKAYGDIQRYIAEQVYVLAIGGQFRYQMIRPRVQNYQAGSLTGEGVETYSKVWLQP